MVPSLSFGPHGEKTAKTANFEAASSFDGAADTGNLTASATAFQDSAKQGMKFCQCIRVFRDESMRNCTILRNRTTVQAKK